MTAIGKILVIVNVALSFFLAGWAMTMYFTRIDWTNTPARAGKPAGELNKLTAEIKRLQAGMVKPRENWVEARQTLDNLTTVRTQNRPWYLAELNHLRARTDMNKPIQAVQYDPMNNGKSLNDNNNPTRPLLGEVRTAAGNPITLRSLQEYNNNYVTVAKDIEDKLVEIDQEIAKDKALTDRRLGPKGLPARLELEKQKKRDREEEQRLVRPLLINAVVESELILQREKSLKARILELGGKVEVASRR
jgi:hypothetical protein